MNIHIKADAQARCFNSISFLRRTGSETSSESWPAWLSRLRISASMLLIFVVVRQSGMDVRQRKPWVLEMNLLGAPTVRQFIEHDFNHFHTSSREPGDP